MQDSNIYYAQLMKKFNLYLLFFTPYYMIMIDTSEWHTSKFKYIILILLDKSINV